MTKLTREEFTHIPVLYNELLDSIKIFEDRQNVIVDGTLGLAWHAQGIIERLNPGDVFIGFDRDEENLLASKANLEKNCSEAIKNKNISIHLIHSNFVHLKTKLKEIGFDSITGAYFDLGVSSAHFDDEKRGFSFRFDSPLDMRFNRTENIPTARDIINGYSRDDLYTLFQEYGEEPKTRFIVDAVMEARKKKSIETTGELADIIGKSSFDPKSKVRIFQALRIETNREFDAIEWVLKDAIKLLENGGICSVITFHSLEDRVVKSLFAQYQKDKTNEFTGRIEQKATIKKVHKKPIEPSENEIKQNPRSRSAKMRVIEKI